MVQGFDPRRHPSRHVAWAPARSLGWAGAPAGLLALGLAATLLMA